MNEAIVILTGFLFSCGIYLIFQRSFFKVIIGVILFSNAANLFLFQSAELQKGLAPLLHAKTDTFADPLPQALILTAIVIGFGLQTMLIVLLKNIYQQAKTDNTDHLRKTDEN